MEAEEEVPDYETRRKASEELVGSRQWLPSNGNLEKPASSWPKQEPDYETRRKASEELAGSRQWLPSNGNLEKPASSWPKQEPDE